MQPVFVHPDPTVVALKKTLLDEAGIDSFIQNENIAATFGAGMLGLVQSAVFDPTLCIIDDSRYEEAMALLKASAEVPGAVRADWNCPRCGESVPGNFDTCWNCSGSAPESAEPGA